MHKGTIAIATTLACWGQSFSSNLAPPINVGSIQLVGCVRTEDSLS